MMTSYSARGSGEDHCSSQPLWPRIASRAMAKTEYFRMISLASQMPGRRIDPSEGEVYH